MAKISKNRKAVLAKYSPEKEYSLEDASKLVKEISFTKFDASVDVDIRLGVDPKKSDQMVRGVVALPHGIGKTVRVLVLCTPDKVQEAKDAGAEHVGLDEFIQKIEGGWTDVDVIICTPTVMAKVGKLGKILGPRGLMPNPKSGTVTLEVGKAVKEVKAGKIDFKIDKQGIIHVQRWKSFLPGRQDPGQCCRNDQCCSKTETCLGKRYLLPKYHIVNNNEPGDCSIDTNSVAGV